MVLRLICAPIEYSCILYRKGRQAAAPSQIARDALTKWDNQRSYILAIIDGRL